MGRLFWKFFAAFWLALMLTLLAMLSVVWLLRWFTPPEQRSFEAERLTLMLNSTATVLQQGERSSAMALLQDWQTRELQPPIYATDGQGADLLGRRLADSELQALPARLAQRDMGVRQVRAPDSKRYTVFASEAETRQLLADAKPKPPSILVPILSASLMSLLVSALLAWYFSKPIRSLRWALHTVAAGHLETRVSPRMGRRRDEIADLGQDFDRMAQQLQQTMGAQTRLLHDVSHELRSPLARLQAAIGLARQRPEKLEASLARIEREAGRLDSLVGELLTLARLEAGPTAQRRERVDAVELLAAIVDDAQFEARSQGRDVRLQAQGEYVGELQAEWLYRAFENVIRNAVKFTAPGSCVEIELQADAQGLRLQVADRGPGVREADLSRMFEPFCRLEDAQQVAGFGLGLAIARRAIEAHGGRISAQAREGGGLLMLIELPALAQA